MKRFTETNKWRDPWFRKLPAPYKLLWLYLCDECDNAGFLDPDMDLASFMVGASLDLQEALKLFTGRVENVNNSGKWRLTKFVAFQFGELSEANPCHRGILKLLHERGIEAPNKGLARGLQAPQEKEKEKEKRKEEDKGESEGGMTPTLEEVLTFADMHGLCKQSAERFWQHYEGQNLWLNRFGRLIKWQVALGSWCAKDRELKPATANAKPDWVVLRDAQAELLEVKRKLDAIGSYDFHTMPKEYDEAKKKRLPLVERRHELEKQIKQMQRQQ